MIDTQFITNYPILKEKFYLSQDNEQNFWVR